MDDNFDESTLEFSSIYYCPTCAGGGKLYIKDTDAYKKRDTTKEYTGDNFCTTCKGTYNISRKRK